MKEEWKYEANHSNSIAYNNDLYIIILIVRIITVIYATT